MQKEMDQLYQDLLDADINIDFAKLEYIYTNNLKLLNIVDCCEEKMSERQFLIELHFIGPLFPLSAHEKYHSVSYDLQVLMTSFFSDAKTFLNDLTRFYIEEIENKYKRGITSKSFGTCLNSINKNLEVLPSRCKELYAPFCKYGALLNSGICYYRDKFIEHSQSLTAPNLNTSLDSIRLFHMKPGSVGRPRSRTDEQKTNFSFLTSSDMLLFEEDSGRTHCFVHVLTDCGLGQSAVSGNKIGKIFDSTGVHFKKYGAHVHYFPPFDETKTGYYSSCTGASVIGESPDLFESIRLIERFTFALLRELKKYKMES